MTIKNKAAPVKSNQTKPEHDFINLEAIQSVITQYQNSLEKKLEKSSLFKSNFLGNDKVLSREELLKEGLTDESGNKQIEKVLRLRYLAAGKLLEILNKKTETMETRINDFNRALSRPVLHLVAPIKEKIIFSPINGIHKLNPLQQLQQRAAQKKAAFAMLTNPALAQEKERDAHNTKSIEALGTIKELITEKSGLDLINLESHATPGSIMIIKVQDLIKTAKEKNDSKKTVDEKAMESKKSEIQKSATISSPAPKKPSHPPAKKQTHSAPSPKAKPKKSVCPKKLTKKSSTAKTKKKLKKTK